MIRGVVKSVVEGVIKRFSASGRADETIDNREYFQHYGYTSRPLAGAEIIIIREGGHFVAVASDDRRYRISLENGEVALYDDLGQTIHLKRTGIEIASPTKITLTAPDVIIAASTAVTMTTPLVQASGDITDATRNMAEDRAIYNSHTHPGDSGGTTGTPNKDM